MFLDKINKVIYKAAPVCVIIFALGGTYSVITSKDFDFQSGDVKINLSREAISEAKELSLISEKSLEIAKLEIELDRYKNLVEDMKAEIKGLKQNSAARLNNYSTRKQEIANIENKLNELEQKIKTTQKPGVAEAKLQKVQEKLKDNSESLEQLEEEVSSEI